MSSTYRSLTRILPLKNSFNRPKFLPLNSFSNFSSSQFLSTSTDSTLPTPSTLTQNPSTFEWIFTNTITFNHDLLINLHSFLGLEWWLTIITGTIIVRSITTLPLAIYQRKQLGKLKELSPILLSWQHTFKKGYNQSDIGRGGGTDVVGLFMLQRKLKSELGTKVKSLFRMHGYSPWSMYLVPIVQLPIFFLMSMTIRTMSNYQSFGYESLANLSVSEFTSGGIHFFYDLTLPDQTLILPMLIGFTHLLNLEIGLLNQKKLNGFKPKALLAIGRGMGLLMIPVAAMSPSALSVYWLSSATYSLIQNLALRSKVAQRVLKT